MVILKIQHREDIRRITLENPKFSTLKELLGQIFPNLNASYSIKWKDDENDLITVTSDIELREAVESNPTTILRLFITEDSPPSIVKRDAATAPQATEGPIHPNVICDGCNNGVVGTRYKSPLSAVYQKKRTSSIHFAQVNPYTLGSDSSIPMLRFLLALCGSLLPSHMA